LFAGSSRSAAGGAADAASSTDTPDWARRLRSEQTARHHRHVAMQAIRDGDCGGAAANPDIKERED
jgi:type IV secretion system protein TrbL